MLPGCFLLRFPLVFSFNESGASLRNASSSCFQESSQTQQYVSRQSTRTWQILFSPGLPHVLHSHRLVNWRCTISSPSCLFGTLLSQGQLHGMPPGTSKRSSNGTTQWLNSLEPNQQRVWRQKCIGNLEAKILKAWKPAPLASSLQAPLPPPQVFRQSPGPAIPNP